MANQGGFISWSRRSETGRSVVQVGGDFTVEELKQLFRGVLQETKDGEIDQPVKIVHNVPELPLIHLDDIIDPKKAPTAKSRAASKRKTEKEK